ncbi:ATP-binding protein [Streptomyces inhibens]|uniref:ATP-binding protein n=1 Tax=Streptomyces inhibens TaxID=2293571 RepID=UPI001EE7255B|nr:ATP-binding protein [Streptomyces inhibens]UKY48539.1 ATP-binding protein [Streptomyces inhibens]
MTPKGWSLPWRRQGPPAAAREHVLPTVRRHVCTVRVGPGAVRLARQEVAATLAEFGFAPRSSLVDAALLVVSELVVNVLRHAAEQSPTADVSVTVAAGQLVIGVADRDPRVPDVEAAAPGGGLRMVAEVASRYDGTLNVEPDWAGHGKSVLARFVIPGGDARAEAYAR